MTTDRVLGAMNIYAHERDAFDEHAAQLGEVFAIPAAILVQHAFVLAQTRRLAVELQKALTNRAAIDHAIGILMSRFGRGPGEASRRLRVMSQSEDQTLYAIALRVVGDAVRRARERPFAPDPVRERVARERRLSAS